MADGPLDEERLRKLVELSGYVTAELDVDAVLIRVLEVARAAGASSGC